MREQSSVSLLMIDVDYFKSFNDSFGHVAGDDALRQVAEMLRNSCTRSSDMAARYGGEEFAIILPGTSSGGARLLAEKVRRAIEGLRIPHDQPKPGSSLSASIGVATLIPRQGQDVLTLVELADQALYQAKHSGRNQVAMLDASLRSG